MTHYSMNCAGVDVSKASLDIVVFDGQRFGEVNAAAGHARLIERLTAAGVELVGLEASGGYEAAVTSALRTAGFTVQVFDPRQLHGFRKWKKQPAKTDAIDAAMILEATLALKAVRPAPDARMAAFQEHLTLIEMLAEDIARLKTRRDRFQAAAHRRFIETEIGRLERRRNSEIAKLDKHVRAHPDLARRLDLALSVPGVGAITALTLIVRMPELGAMRREEAAALAGVAPYNCDSGAHTGERHVMGGRARLRKVLFMAAFSAASHWNADLVAFRKRLKAAGKHHTKIIVACARKLIHIVNAVLARNAPWTQKTAA